MTENIQKSIENLRVIKKVSVKSSLIDKPYEKSFYDYTTFDENFILMNRGNHILKEEVSFDYENSSKEICCNI